MFRAPLGGDTKPAPEAQRGKILEQGGMLHEYRWTRGYA
jgi:hypothetical protein